MIMGRRDSLVERKNWSSYQANLNELKGLNRIKWWSIGLLNLDYVLASVDLG